MEGRSSRRADARAVDSVLRAVDFVEEHLGDDIGVEDIAGAACFSPFYFSRLFVEATGHAPYDYLMRRRVAAAAEEVVGSDRSLTEIALDRGFTVQDGFARAFRRCFGLLPSEARRSGTYPREMARTRIERTYVEEMLANPPGRPEEVRAAEIVLEGNRKDHLDMDRLAVGDLAVVERGPTLAPGGAFVGSVIVDGSFPSYPLAATRLSAGTRARFQIEGDTRRLAFMVEFAYRAWLPSSSYIRTATYDLVERVDDAVLFLDLPLKIDSVPKLGDTRETAPAASADQSKAR